jgi:hypothetical protein
LVVLWYQAVYMIGPIGAFGWAIACAYTFAFWAVFALTVFGAQVPELVQDGAMFGLMQMTWAICSGGRPGPARGQLPGPGSRGQLTGPGRGPRHPPPGASREALKQHHKAVLDWLAQIHGDA